MVGRCTSNDIADKLCVFKWGVAMSNVLIGIIGVILFIGLALAGALFLGVRFQESSSNSKASAAIQAAYQTASAYNMFALEDGGAHVTGGLAEDDDLFVKGYLKPGVGAPYVGQRPYLMDEFGSGVGNTNRPMAVAIVMGSGVRWRSVCEAVERQTGRLSSSQPFNDAIRSFASADLVGNAGCQFNGSSYVTFVKL